MAYIITGDTLGLAIGPVSETANNVHEALNKARQMTGERINRRRRRAQNRRRRSVGLHDGTKDDHQRSSGKIDFAIISRTDGRYCRRCSVIGIP